MNGLKYILFILLFPLQAFSSPQTVSFQYYSEHIQLDYEDNMIPNTVPKANKESIALFYDTLDKSTFRPVLLQLASYKRKFSLNGYLYYDLIHQAVQHLCKDKNGNYKTLLEWFLLSKSGVDTRLTYVGQAIYLYAYSQENIYNIPIVQIQGKDYINLTSFKYAYTSSKSSTAFIVDIVVNPNGKPLSFSLQKLPNLSAQPMNKEMVFAHRNELYRFDITLDKTLIDLMENYPLVDELYYIETPISSTLQASLVKKLRELMEKKSKQESVQFLLSLTRTAFNYKTDLDNFGKNKPMIPDEVLYYAHSDCEDRSALFYALIKELVDLPTIVVDYPEHLTIGVALPENIGKPLLYEGRSYTICDPTGPSNTDEVGIYPEGYETLPYKIALSFK